MSHFREALDFGCGCGRLLLHVGERWPHIRWSGTDVDAESVRWCAENIPTVTVATNAPQPPLEFADERFDLIWCGSVFTHLDEGRQDAWLQELARLLSPNGCMLASVHGENCWPAIAAKEIEKKGLFFASTGADKGLHPDWYQTTWHTQEYINGHWSKFMKVTDYVVRGLHNYHDLVVMRKRAA